MITVARIRKEIPDCSGLFKVSTVAAIALGIAVIGSTGVREGKVAEPRASVAKTTETRTPPMQSVRPEIATQKLMRNPWERPDSKVEVMASQNEVSSESLPYFYW